MSSSGFAVACAVLVALGIGGCSRSAAPDTSSALCPCGDAGTPVDPVLMAFLSRARTAHRLADGFEAHGQLDRAVGALQAVVRGPVPGGTHPAPEAREVLADTHARLADLLSRSNHFDEAEREIDRGLSFATDTTYFRGNLFDVRGLVEERRAKALRAAGDEAHAVEAEKRAVDASEASMAIQAQVVERATRSSKKQPAANASGTPQ